jgi:DNA-binding HxlR family transcriptional regulator
MALARARAIRHLWVPVPVKLKAVECEVERLLAVIGGKWKVLILRELFNGARRHAQLIRALPGVSQKVLTAQLRELELDGAITRRDFHTKPPRVEYSLTSFGEKLRGLILGMHDLALENCELLKRRPPSGRFDRAAAPPVLSSNRSL